MKLTSALSAATAGAAVLLTTACGSLPGEGGLLGRHSEFLDKSPRAIWDASLTDMRKVTSVRMIGSVASGDYGMTDFDIRLDGTDCAGRFDTDDGTIKFIRTGSTSWLTFDDDMWTSKVSSERQAAQLAKTYSDAWFVAEEDDFAKLCDLQELWGGFKVDDNGTGEIDVGEVEEVGDVEAVALSGREGKKRCTVWVSVASPHVIVKLTQSRPNREPEEFYFEEFGADVVVEPPDKRDVKVLPGTAA